MPSSCAVVTISSHWSAGSLPLVRTQRTSSSRISAAVPGTESSPASLTSSSQARAETPCLADAVAISMGENACTWIPGAADFTARHDVGVGTRP